MQFFSLMHWRWEILLAIIRRMAKLLQPPSVWRAQPTAPLPIVVTSCTTRKRATTPPVVPAGGTRSESLSVFAKRWLSRLEKASRTTTAGELYVGRSIAEVKRVTHTLKTEFYVVSAGLGLVHESAPVPNYDLTVASGQGLLADALQNSRESAAHWWRLLAEHSGHRTPVADMVDKTNPRIVLLALPSNYLGLVSDDLTAIATEAQQRLRIFTSEAGLRKIPQELAHCVLPYDERLESVSGFDGTRADFPQRALRHFVLKLRGHTLTLADARSAVHQALGGLQPRTVPVRAKRTDDQIIDLIRRHWTTYSGNSARLLRVLRDQEFVACEQSRFRDLWRLVKKEQIRAKTEDQSVSA